MHSATRSDLIFEAADDCEFRAQDADGTNLQVTVQAVGETGKTLVVVESSGDFLLSLSG
jgi:hypothetical protein